MAFSYSSLKHQQLLALSAPMPVSKRASAEGAYDKRLAELGCKGCPLNRIPLEHPKMEPTGPRDASVYIIGEAPGEAEDQSGVQFVGKAGQYLRRHLPKGIEKEIRWNNVVRCRPPNNREPTRQEIECCRKKQEDDIEAVRPAVVIGMGNVPLSWFLGADVKKIGAWRGRAVAAKIGEHCFWYVPSYHPSYMARMQHAERGSEELESVFESDLEFAVQLAQEGEPPTVLDPDDRDEGVELLPCDLTVVAEALEKALAWDFVGTDIETIGIQPYAKDPKMLTISFSNYVTTYAIPVRHREATWKPDELQKLYKLLRRFLTKSKPKIAHNSVFEQEWLAVLLGDSVVFEAIWHDTQAQAFTLDERQGANSLSAVSSRTIGFDVKSLSNIDVAKLDFYPLRDVLRYNAYDAKYLYPIFHIQQGMLKEAKLLRAYKLKAQRAGPLAVAQKCGVAPNFDAIEKFRTEYTAEIKRLDEEIQDNKDMREFQKIVGEFRTTSNPKLIKFFGQHLGIKKIKTSVDESVLQTIDHPVAKLVLERRALDKKLGTYIEPLRKDGGKQIHADGLIHTKYNHLRTATDRLSSEDPNVQNFPRRKGVEIRAVIAAPKGFVFVAFDYGQVEARVIAMASKDKTLTDALWEGYDIHGSWAEKIAYAHPAVVGGKKNLKDKTALKVFRDLVKNKWTFPLFFGSQLSSAANDLEVPERTLAPLFDEFWDMFYGVHRWQKEVGDFYLEHGYVETLTGHRRRAPLDWQQRVNTPIQGTAAGIVCEAMVVMSKRAYYEDKPHWQFRLQIHDDLSFYLPEKSVDDDCSAIAEELVRVRYPWVNVPLTVECKMGTDWANLEEVATISSTAFGHKRS